MGPTPARPTVKTATTPNVLTAASSCSCHDCEHWAAGADSPDRPALWHGVDPGAEVARDLGWWTTAVGIDYPVEDHTRVNVAVALGQVSWDPRTQRYTVGQLDLAEVERCMPPWAPLPVAAPSGS